MQLYTMLALLVSLKVLLFCVVEADLDVVVLDAECVNVNYDYVKNGSCTMEISDDMEYGSTFSTGIAIQRKFPDNCEFTIKVTQSHNGEYKMATGIDLVGDLCNYFGEDKPGSPMLSIFGIEDDNCPPTSGEYASKNQHVEDISGLPDAFPYGEFQVNCSIICNDIEIVTITSYIKVE